MKIFHALFSICCHQYAGRSPQYSGEVFPACFRCAGMYFGVLSSYLFLFLHKGSAYFETDRKTGSLLVLLTIPLAADGLANLAGFWSTPGELRLLTGVLCGVALPLLLALLRNSSVDRKQLHPMNFTYVFIPVAVCFSLLSLFIFLPSFFIFHLLAALSTAGLVLIILNMIISLTLIKSATLSGKKE